MAQFCWEDMSSERETSNDLSQITSPVKAMAHTGSKTDDDVKHRRSIFVPSRNVEEEPAGPDDDFSYGPSRNVEEEPAGLDDDFSYGRSRNVEEEPAGLDDLDSEVPLSSFPENSFEGDIRWHNDQGSFNVISKITEENKRIIRRIGLSVNKDGLVATQLKDIFGSAYYQLSIRRLPLPSSTISEDVLLHNGRYKKDFEDPQPIGEGGFGVVTQVKSNVDNQHYAVKMVKFKSDGITWEKFSREVTILAKLTKTHNHRIVRYHTAWLEEKDFSEPDTTESDDGGSHSSKPLTKYVLYIQMELCGKTLLIWLEDRNKKSQKDYPFNCVNRTTNIQILKQILEGISFLHEKGIWHRDLKPANIFLTERQLDVKIGDFGLAREVPYQEEENVEAVNPRPGGDQLFTYIGTYPYTAPEQLPGSVYDSKADMYSFGIIKYEMFLPYKSFTETYKSIEVLRKDGVIPEEKLKSEWSEEAELIELLTNKNKMDRPSASDVLKNGVYSDHNQQTEDKELEKVKEERDQLRRENEKKEKIIKELEEQLKALQMKEKNS